MWLSDYKSGGISSKDGRKTGNRLLTTSTQDKNLKTHPMTTRTSMSTVIPTKSLSTSSNGSKVGLQLKDLIQIIKWRDFAKVTAALLVNVEYG
ncbi:hypothetical protein P8C59_006140 [Phyllachora maydis]|uniref:Uncharacterized protein n=1 Tax=Phyllachora maydis TaxID=1825666 RepID=A0AAD9I7J3_9PEZI|nr:hypothetical protein P8C59_006140 [Phyllachora maydis]